MDLTLDTHRDTQLAIPPDEQFTPPVVRDTATLLRSAIPLIEEDRPSAEANIAYAQSEEAELNLEILRIQQNLDKLQQRQSAIRKFKEMEMGLLSPIRKLPMEVLRNIFILANENPFACYDYKSFPRIAAQVCSYWRSVVHSCAPLWTKIYCTFLNQKHQESYNSQYSQSIMDCLYFSDRMPLSLFITDGFTPKLLGDRCVQELGRSARRWRDAFIWEGSLAKAVFGSVPKDTILEHLETLDLQTVNDTMYIASAPKLKRLTLSGNSTVMPPPSGSVVIESAPSLVKLSLGTIHNPLTSLVGLDWSTITHFEVTKVQFQPNELIAILERMPNLVSLVVQGPTQDTGSVVVPNLESFKTGECYDLDTSVFDSLIAPRLKKLEVEWGTDWEAMAIFVGRSGCKIEEVELSGPHLDAAWQVPVFSSVKTLCWDDPFAMGEAIEMLMYGSTPSPNDIFTGLENLHIKSLNAPKANDDWSRFIMMVYLLSGELVLCSFIHTPPPTKSHPFLLFIDDDEVELIGPHLDAAWQVPVFSSVKTLRWDDSFAMGEAIEMLMYGSTPSPNDIFTGLETLHIKSLNAPKANDDWSVVDLVNMVQSRLRPQQTEVSETTRSYLKSVRIELTVPRNGDANEEHAQILSNFVHSEIVRNSGVHMEISCGGLHLSTSA